MTERYQDLIDKRTFGGKILQLDVIKDGFDLPSFARVEPLDQTTFELFSEVLFQPETKRKQRYTVAELQKPEQTIHLHFDAATLSQFFSNEMSSSVAATTPPRTLAIELRRPSWGEAISLHVSVADGANVELVFFEKTNPVLAANNGKKPAVFLSAEVGNQATLDMVYLHPLYLEEDGLRQYLEPQNGVTFLYYGKVARGGKFRWTSINIGDSLVEKGMVDLVAPRAEVDLGGAAYIPDGCEQFYQYKVRCRAPKAKAFVRSHGVVDDGGNGRVVSVADIAKGASDAKLREENRFITLGKNARAYADPTLLIDEYDVEASHAATVGQMDEEAMFYLQSRGLTEDQAKRLVTAGFLMPLVDRIPQLELRGQLAEILSERMHSLGGVASE